MLYTFEIFTSDVYEAVMLIDNILSSNNLNEAEKVGIAKKLSNILGAASKFSDTAKGVADVFSGDSINIAKSIKNWLSGSGGKMSSEDIKELIDAWESIYTSLSDKMKKTKDEDIKTINKILTKHDPNLKKDIDKYEFLKHTVTDDLE